MSNETQTETPSAGKLRVSTHADIEAYCEEHGIMLTQFNVPVSIARGTENCDGLFAGCTAFNQSVYVPASVISCDNMFYNCTGLDGVYLNFPPHMQTKLDRVLNGARLDNIVVIAPLSCAVDTITDRCDVAYYTGRRITEVLAADNQSCRDPYTVQTSTLSAGLVTQQEEQSASVESALNKLDTLAKETANKLEHIMQREKEKARHDLLNDTFNAMHTVVQIVSEQRGKLPKLSLDVSVSAIKSESTSIKAPTVNIQSFISSPLCVATAMPDKLVVALGRESHVFTWPGCSDEVKSVVDKISRGESATIDTSTWQQLV